MPAVHRCLVHALVLNEMRAADGSICRICLEDEQQQLGSNITDMSQQLTSIHLAFQIRGVHIDVGKRHAMNTV